MNAEMTQLAANLAWASAMVATTVLIHFWGLTALAQTMHFSRHRLRPHESHARLATLILFTVFGIFALHTVEIWLYAALYLGLGEMGSLEEALYFATVTFASLGYGDVVLSPRWRVLSAIEGANGVILFAWSTAFLLAVMERLRFLQHDWLAPPDRDGE